MDGSAIGSIGTVMEDFAHMMDGVPTWAGSVPLWFLLATVLVTLIKTWPVIMEKVEIAKANRNNEKRDIIAELRAEVQKCREDCDAREEERDRREAALREEIDNLKTRLNNEAWQRTQSEISLVRTLLDVVPAQQLKTILVELQKKQATASAPPKAKAVDGPISDANANGDI